MMNGGLMDYWWIFNEWRMDDRRMIDRYIVVLDGNELLSDGWSMDDELMIDGWLMMFNGW